MAAKGPRRRIGALYRKAPIDYILRPFRLFARNSSAGGVLLAICVAAAMLWANSAWSADYFSLWQQTAKIQIGAFEMEKTLKHWIDDGLMAIFFFLVGLEIKREMLAGELADLRKALFPLVAALGGMLAPALVYLLLLRDPLLAHGWAIPTATDIAFALGILSLLGERAPLSLKVFLTALAIVDDIGAIVIIGLFYSAPPDFITLGLAASLLVVMAIVNWLGVRHSAIYAAFAFFLWLLVLQSGIHATIAGVLAAMAVPARAPIDTRPFIEAGEKVFRSLAGAGSLQGNILRDAAVQDAVEDLTRLCDGVETPLQKMERGLHPWVSFLILPLFALANAGVQVIGGSSGPLLGSLGIAVIGGLLIGKSLGIFGAAWLSVKCKLCTKPRDLSWRQLFGAACLGGIGFTMSLFITALTFATPHLADQAKLGVLLGSFCAALLGAIVIATAGPRKIKSLENK